jgi:hypothetical protein
MNYKKPNPKAEWPEALRYRIFERMGYEAWVELVKKGKPLNFSEINKITGNIDLDYESLDPEKKARFEKAFETGDIEMPIVARFKKYKFDLVGGNTRLAGLIAKNYNPKVWVIDVRDGEEGSSASLDEKINPHDPDDDKDDVFPTGSSDWRKKNDVKETDASSAGAYVAPFGGKSAVVKRPISKIPNFMNEALDSSVSASAAFDVPFGGGGTKGRRDPLKIDGPKSIYKTRAVKDKKFPRFGGPDAVFVKIKEACKKFPYCNQGDQNNLQFLHEDEEFKDAISKAAQMYGIPYSDVEKIVINEIKKIFI